MALLCKTKWLEVGQTVTVDGQVGTGVIQEWDEDTWMYKVLLKKCKGRKKDIEEWVASTEVHAAVPLQKNPLGINYFANIALPIIHEDGEWKVHIKWPSDTSLHERLIITTALKFLWIMYR